MPAFNGVYYESFRSYSHNVSARVDLVIKPDGTWEVLHSASPGGGTSSGAPTAGNWHAAPAPGVGAGFEVMFNGEGTIADNYTENEPQNDTPPQISPDTGWLPITVNRIASVYTGHMVDERQDAGGMREVSATFTVSIRPIGGGLTVVATIDMTAIGISDF